MLLRFSPMLTVFENQPKCLIGKIIYQSDQNSNKYVAGFARHSPSKMRLFELFLTTVSSVKDVLRKS